MVNFTLRVLVPGDAVVYRALRLQNLQDHPEAFTSSSGEEMEKDLSHDALRLALHDDAPHDFFIGAFDGPTLAGMVGLKGAYRPKECHTATVVGMMVDASYRRQGVGERLMRDLLVHVKTLPALEQLVLTVTEGNASAQNLYARCGFVVYGLRPKAIKVDGRLYGKVHMVLDLDAA
jgi:ribosomal protein S18 acetylase RimI-like enzyme